MWHEVEKCTDRQIVPDLLLFLAHVHRLIHDHYVMEVLAIGMRVV